MSSCFRWFWRQHSASGAASACLGSDTLRRKRRSSSQVSAWIYRSLTSGHWQKYPDCSLEIHWINIKTKVVTKVSREKRRTDVAGSFPRGVSFCFTVTQLWVNAFFQQREWVRTRTHMVLCSVGGVWFGRVEPGCAESPVADSES